MKREMGEENKTLVHPYEGMSGLTSQPVAR